MPQVCTTTPFLYSYWHCRERCRTETASSRGHDARGTALTKRRVRLTILEPGRPFNTGRRWIRPQTSPEYEVKSSAFAELRAQIFSANKRMLFEVLASAGAVVLEFDGCGDSGQI